MGERLVAIEVRVGGLLFTRISVLVLSNTSFIPFSEYLLKRLEELHVVVMFGEVRVDILVIMVLPLQDVVVEVEIGTTDFTLACKIYERVFMGFSYNLSASYYLFRCKIMVCFVFILREVFVLEVHFNAALSYHEDPVFFRCFFFF